MLSCKRYAAYSYLFLLVTETRVSVLKIRTVRFESDWGHSRRAYSSAVAILSLPRAILGP